MYLCDKGIFDVKIFNALFCKYIFWKAKIQILAFHEEIKLYPCQNDYFAIQLEKW